MSPLKRMKLLVVILIMATGPAALAAGIEKATQESLGLRTLQSPDSSRLRQSPANSSKQQPMQAGLQPKAAVSSNGVVYSATALVDVQQLVTGWTADGNTFACYANRGFDGSYSLSADGVNGPIIVDAQLPGGQTLTNPANNNLVQMGGWRDSANITTIFFMAVDPNHKLQNGQPFLSLWFADSTGRSGSLLANGSTFTSKDPRSNLDTTYTVSQLSGLEVRKGKVTTLLVATPPSQSSSIPPVPQGLFVQVGTDKQVNTVFNNLKDANNNFWFSTLTGFVQTDTSLYIAGQLAATPPTPVPPAKTSNQVGICRIQNSAPVMVKDYFSAAGSLMNSWNSGVQITSLDSTGQVIKYSFLPDNSLPTGTSFNSGEIALFSGSVIDGVNLTSQDLQIPTGQKDLYVISSGTGSLLQVSNGQARLIHSTQMAPGGSARGVSVTGNKTVYVQNEGSVNRTYLMYILPTALPLLQALPGDIVTIDGSNLIIDNTLPSFSLIIGGAQVEYGASSSGKITVNIPIFAAPGNYTGTFTVQGVKISQPIAVQTPGQAAPVITSVLNGANFQADALVAREHVSIFLTKAATGSQASLISYPAFALGSMSAQLDGTPMPSFFNSGSGQMNVVLPKSAAAAGKSQGNVTVSITYPNGNTVTSLPFSINIGPVDDSFFQFNDADGKLLPIVTHVNNSLVTKANPAAVGETVVGYGTGCAPDPAKLPDDGQVNPASIPSAVTPSLLVAGLSAQVTFAGLAQSFVGLCQYNFVIPSSTGSGDNTMQFSGTAYAYTLRVK